MDACPAGAADAFTLGSLKRKAVYHSNGIFLVIYGIVL
jgi:hypothetical protein